jgi:hypothetical protein
VRLPVTSRSQRHGVGLLVCLLLACAAQDPFADREAYYGAIEDPAGLRANLVDTCPQVQELDDTIRDAVSIGAPIYNAGSALGCYRIYEGAAYKILYRLDGSCPRAASFLRAGLGVAESEHSFDAKAWALRRTFDAMLGEATRYGSPDL